VTVDKDRVNEDSDRKSNRKVVPCKFIAERMPNLASSISRVEQSRRNDWGALREGFIKYYYECARQAQPGGMEVRHS